MKVLHKGTAVNFKSYGSSENVVLMLHGWADSAKSMSFFCDKLNADKRYIVVDFPPFGDSGHLKCAWKLDDYASICIKILDKLEIDNVDIISHSFGGRVAIYLANYYTKRVKRIIFIASAGLKYKTNFFTKLKIFVYKLQKLFKAKRKLKGSKEYESLCPVMKQTFSNIVGFNQKSQAELIDNECLIIWGSEDRTTPLYMGKKLNRLIKNSALIIFNGASHYAHYDEMAKFISITNTFLKE